MSTSSITPEPEPSARRWALWPEPEPPFGVAEAVAVIGAVLLLTLLGGVVVLALTHHGHLGAAAMSGSPRPLLLVQLVAYLVVFAALWRLFAHHHRVGFFTALQWQWPRQWTGFVAGGILLAFAVQGISHLLPTPPELPIDKMMRNTMDAWLMSGFGILIAPLAEEVMFRGLLFPALARHTGGWISLLAISLLFGTIHAEQLAGAWMQVGMIALVGLALGAVRWRWHSLASSTLVHVGYNATLFCALFVQTHGFTNFNLH
jgi:hypothetical protein